MNKNKKRINIIIIVFLLLFAAAGLFIINYNAADKDKGKIAVLQKEKNIEDAESANHVNPARQMNSAGKAGPARQIDPAVKSAAIRKELTSEEAEKNYKDMKFESNEEIKNEFGRLEIVYLYNGQNFTGYVISIDEFYTMITIDGFKKIQMKDVKIREIIN